MFATQRYGEYYGSLPTITSEYSHPQDAQHNIGQPVPGFQLLTTEGQVLRLSDFQGSPIIVAFVKTWGRLCQSQLPALTRLSRESGMPILAICSGEESCAIEDFVNEHGITFPVLHDPDSEVKRQYEVTCLPMTFCIDQERRIAGFHRGEVDEAILSHWLANVSPVGALL